MPISGAEFCPIAGLGWNRIGHFIQFEDGWRKMTKRQVTDCCQCGRRFLLGRFQGWPLCSIACRTEFNRERNLWWQSQGLRPACCHEKNIRLENGKKTRLYRIFLGMHGRCNCKSDSGYARYGARGIRVCKAWRSFEKFHKWSTDHGYRDDLTLDRINGDKDYAPQNCRWATPREQANNRAPSTRRRQRAREQARRKVREAECERIRKKREPFLRLLDGRRRLIETARDFEWAPERLRARLAYWARKRHLKLLFRRKRTTIIVQCFSL